MEFQENLWLPRRGPRPNSRLRLFCIPHAGGGSAVYHRWANEFPQEIDVLPVLLPGRERRISEPALHDLRELVTALADALALLVNDSFALFGHSMGALVAFELCRQLRRRGLNPPRCLFVAAYRAPQIASRSDPIYHLSDSELVREIQERFQGIPQEIAQSPELLKLFLPALRADIAKIETYEYYAEPPLACPIVALGGIEDRGISPADLAAWRQQTTGAFVQKLLPGGHFFVTERPNDVARIVRSQLEQRLA